MTRKPGGPRLQQGDSLLRLRLYIAGEAPNSVAALRNLRATLARAGQSKVDLEIVDVLEAPERGRRDGILVTPTLVRFAPAPERRVVGNLSATEMVRAALGLKEGDS